MARTLLVRGMLAGLAAGIVAFLIAKVFGEGSVAQAIAVEGAHAGQHGAAPAAGAEDELVSRGTQAGFGLFVATVFYGVGLGGVFALVFAGLLGRLGALRARTLAGLLGLAGFVAVALVPFVKYPPNPPAVGNGDTIGRRTTLFLFMLLISVLVAVLAVIAGRRLAPALGGWNATIAAAAGYVVVIGLAIRALPVIQEVPADFPATVLYEFRISALLVQASVWATLALGFGALAERAVTPAAAGSGVRPVPATV